MVTYARGYGAVGCRPLGLGVAELPATPRTLHPRIAVWRQLRRLGAAQLSDGLVTLPADARTREQLDWVAATVAEAGGTAGVWLARPASLAQERDLAAAMAAARATEYQSLRDQAKTAAGLPAAERARVARRLRDQLRASAAATSSHPRSAPPRWPWSTRWSQAIRPSRRPVRCAATRGAGSDGGDRRGVHLDRTACAG